MAIRTKALALALLCCFSASAIADDDDEGAYVAINGGKASAGASGHSYFATIGYQYTSNWALEASYGKLGYVGTPGYGGNALGVSATAVATLHVGNDFAVFVKGGVVNTDFGQGATGSAGTPILTNATRLAAGAGLQYDFAPKISVRAQSDYFGSYTLYSGAPTRRILATTLGLVFKY